MRHNHDAEHRRGGRQEAHQSKKYPRQDRYQQRIADVDIDEQERAGPEQEEHHMDSRSLSRGFARAHQAARAQLSFTSRSTSCADSPSMNRRNQISKLTSNHSRSPWSSIPLRWRSTNRRRTSTERSPRRAVRSPSTNSSTMGENAVRSQF